LTADSPEERAELLAIMSQLSVGNNCAREQVTVAAWQHICAN